MRLEPVVAHAVVDHQAHLEGGGGFHAFGDDGRDALLFGTEHVDDQFVVYLKDHRMPSAAKRRWTLIMAIFMMSAADPWIGAFTALRSARPRATALCEEMSLR